MNSVKPHTETHVGIKSKGWRRVVALFGYCGGAIGQLQTAQLSDVIWARASRINRV